MASPLGCDRSQSDTYLDKKENPEAVVGRGAKVLRPAAVD
jgi:hypothetical protein